jgi:hypothetical protein
MAQWEVSDRNFILPKLRPEVEADRAAPYRQTDLAATDVYPFLGTNRATFQASNTPPEGPVSGPSMPESGARLQEPPFDGLSPEMADLAWKRTSAIMVGSRPGC